MFAARLSAIAAIAMLAAGPAHAQDDVMVVFDGSNSMWGQIDGVAKIQIARDAMDRLLGDWAAKTNVGLMAYGHRRKGDCSDIETIIPPGPLDEATFLARVNAIVPTGKTPLTTAVEEAARLLSYRDTPATVVLISDGIESCDRDPCALAEELERTGVRFTAHVVGFGLASAEEQEALACIADKTGGEFIAAADAGELEAALGQVSVAVAAQPAPTPEPEPEPKPEPVQATAIELTAPETVTAGATFDVGWSATLDKRDQVTIVPANADPNKIGNHVRVRDRSEARLRAPADPGLYEVRYVLAAGRSVAGRRAIEVTPAEVTLEAPQNVIAGESFDVTWSKVIDGRDMVTIVPAGTDEGKVDNHLRVRDRDRGSLRAPAQPGLYEVRYVLDEGRRTVTIAMVEVTEPAVNITAPAVVVAGASFDVAWSTVIDGRDIVTIVPVGTKEGKVETHLRVRDSAEGELRAPAAPGLYEVRYVLDEGRRTLAVAMIEVTEPEATVNAPETVVAGARFEVTWGTAVDGRDIVTIVPAGTDENKIEGHIRVRDKRQGQLTAPAAPGLYEVRYVLDVGRRVLAVAMLEVTEPDVAVTATDKVRAGGEIEVTWTGQAPNGQDIVTVVPLGSAEGEIGTHHRVRDRNEVALKAPDAPGIYEVRYVLNEGRRTLATAPVEVVDASAPIDTGGSLDVPEVAAPGASVDVSWSTSSTSDRLRVSLARSDQPDFTWIEAKSASNEAPLVFTMPDEPGTYEFRLLDLAGPKVMSRAIIEVR